MEVLNKIEAIINKLLEKLGAFLVIKFFKFLPPKILLISQKIQAYKNKCIQHVKTFPQTIKTKLAVLLVYLKSSLSSFDFKAIFAAFLEKYKIQKTDKNQTSSKLKRVLLTPFLLLNEWIKGMSITQTLLMFGFTGASILASIGMIFSSNRILNQTQMRAPASAEIEVLYERPDYYKEDSRHMSISNFRLPVYVAEVNQIRSVDIDFIATMSNRNIKKFLELNEFQLRDHFVNNFEPLIATFPLEEEGKEVIKKKILLEINAFLKLYNKEGNVEDLKITYILAN